MSKKNSLFIFIFICLFMFVGIDRVEAEVDNSGLTCLYHNNFLKYVAVVQTEEGLYFYEYTHEDYDPNVGYISDTVKQDSEVSDMLSTKSASELLSFFKKRGIKNAKYDDVDSSLLGDNNKLLSCPNWAYYKQDDKGEISELTFRDESLTVSGVSRVSFLKKIDYNPFAVESSGEQIVVGDSCPSKKELSEYWIRTPNENEWNNACLYYFDGEDGCLIYQVNYKYDADNGPVYENWLTGTNANFSDSKLSSGQFLYFSNSCPPHVYGIAWDGVYGADNQYYVSLVKQDLEDIKGDIDEFDLANSLEAGNSSIIINPNIEIKDCEDLLSKEMLDLLSSVRLVLQVSVPLILIIMGIVDFASSVFSGKEDDMKKNVSKFVKRLLIAVVIFLVPSILKLLLIIASSIWPNIDPTLCNII